MKLRRVALAIVAVPALAAAWVVVGLPARGDVRALAKGNPGKTSVMRQREKEAKGAGRTPRTQQAWVPLSRISKHLIHAVIASEDQKFFGHEGVDWEAVEKAIDEDRRGSGEHGLPAAPDPPPRDAGQRPAGRRVVRFRPERVRDPATELVGGVRHPRLLPCSA
jgi:hypothetical protein